MLYFRCIISGISSVCLISIISCWPWRNFLRYWLLICYYFPRFLYSWSLFLKLLKKKRLCLSPLVHWCKEWICRLLDYNTLRWLSFCHFDLLFRIVLYKMYSVDCNNFFMKLFIPFQSSHLFFTCYYQTKWRKQHSTPRCFILSFGKKISSSTIYVDGWKVTMLWMVS